MIAIILRPTKKKKHQTIQKPRLPLILIQRAHLESFQIFHRKLHIGCQEGRQNDDECDVPLSHVDVLHHFVNVPDWEQVGEVIQP